MYQIKVTAAGQITNCTIHVHLGNSQQENSAYLAPIWSLEGVGSYWEGVRLPH